MDKTGKKIEKYVLTKRIGKGMYGEVYLAKSTEDGSLFAVKVLDKNVGWPDAGHRQAAHTAQAS